ncbi:cysteine hydrolase family protein [Labrys neptuniae]
MTKRALILVDIQNDYFPGGKWTLTGIEPAAANAARLLDAARAKGDLVVHVRHEAPAEAPFFAVGSEGAEINQAVANRAGEEVVVKNFPNSFRATGLRDLLDGAGVSDVLIAGAMSHMCIEATARAAADFGYAVTVAHDAAATRDLEFGGVTVPAAQAHAAAMASLAFGYAKLASTDELLAG